MGLNYPIGYILHDDITKTTQPDNYFTVYGIDIHYTDFKQYFIISEIYTQQFDGQQYSNTSDVAIVP